MAIRIFQATSSLSQDISAFIAGVNTSLSGLGNATPMTFTLRGTDKGLFQLTIAYIIGGVAPMQVAVGYDTTANDPQGSTDQLNTFFAANPTFRPVYFQSVPRQNAKTAVKQVAALYQDGGFASASPVSKSMLVARANAGDIAVGASGTVDLIDAADATITTVTVTNRGGVNWPNGEEGWVFFDDVASIWLGYATCCAGP